MKVHAGRSAAARIGILYGDGEGASGCGVASGGELRCGDIGGGESRGAEEDLRALDKVVAGDGEREAAEIRGGGRNASEDGCGIQERDGAGGRLGRVGDTGGLDGDGV